MKLGNLKGIEGAVEFPSNGSPFIAGSSEFFVVLDGKVDKQKEAEAVSKELNYTRGFLAAVEKKLQNEKFISSAPPEVLEIERKKRSDAEMKIKSLERALSDLK